MLAVTEIELDNRVAKIEGWLDRLNEDFEALLSRAHETSGEAGFDPAPRLRPCEHRREWMRGRLCLACDNTGLRRATEKERIEGRAYDPYSLNLPKTTTGVRVDASDAARRSRDIARLDASIASLQRDARIRAGAEVVEDPILRALRLVARRPPALRKIERALGHMREVYPDIYVGLYSRKKRSLQALALLVPGRIEPPPATS